MSREINMRRANDYHMNPALFIYQRKINTRIFLYCKYVNYFIITQVNDYFLLNKSEGNFFLARVRLYFITGIIILDNSNRSCDIKELFVQTMSSLSKWKRSKRTRSRICGTFPTAIFSSAKWFYSKLYNTVSYI